MDMNKFTQKSLEALKEAETSAIANGNYAIEPEHLLVSLLNQEQGLIGRLITKIGKDIKLITDEIQNIVNNNPRVSGSGRESGKIYISNDTDKLLIEATKIAEKMKDQFISVEHMFLGFFELGRSNKISEVFRRYDIKKMMY